ncbi:MAG: hypothetical protein ABTD50_20970 [Polyangiaceae bacterium]|jgi:hypothetical protein
MLALQMGAYGWGGCDCPVELHPTCCSHGVCQMASTDTCAQEGDTLPACAIAGGTCQPLPPILVISNGSGLSYGLIYPPCTDQGPANSCADAGEMCCLPE